MLVDAQGKFCSQRELPELGNLRVGIEDEGLLLDEAHLVPFAWDASEAIEVQVWRDTLLAQLAPPETQAWVRARFGQALRLVRYFEQSRRDTEQGDPVAFADGFPLLVCTQASLEDLNTRTQAPAIDMRAFRPNLVIDATTPWEEDQWRQLQVGQATLELISACVRCKVTTLCPDDPHREHPHKDPLRSLAQFRRTEKGVTFGWNAVLRGPDTTLRSGDPVKILDSL